MILNLQSKPVKQPNAEQYNCISNRPRHARQHMMGILWIRSCKYTGPGLKIQEVTRRVPPIIFKKEFYTLKRVLFRLMKIEIR